MQYLPNNKSPWLTYQEMIPAMITPENFRKMKERGQLKVSCTGGNGRQIFIEFDSLPIKYKQLVIAAFGDPREYIAMEPLKNMVVRDEAARQFYSETYQLPNGEPLPIAYQIKYGRQCDWLNAISRVMMDKRSVKDYLNITMDQFWANITLLARNDEEAGLPTSVSRMRRRWKLYQEQRYAGLVDEHRFGNQHARKVDDKIESLILALHDMNHSPYQSEVCKMYGEFMQGEKKVVHLETGEVFNPEDYYVKGQPYELALSTVKHYLNKKGNKAIVDKKRMSALEFNNTHRPHMMRTGPFFSFSKCTMDDTSSPFKMYNGDRPATYKMFDVASEALVVMVMHKEKRPDVPLIRQMIRDFVGMIARKGWRMPHEIEMERALTSSMKGTEELMDVFYNGAVFPYIRWCAPKNPQEKRAEGFINRLKNGYHRQREGFQKRPFNKLTANRENADLKDVMFSFDEIEAFEREDMQDWNNSKHSDQQTYPGLTRWQVLEQCQNPALPVMNLSLVIPYVGYKVQTSVSRMRIQVQYNKYELPDTTAMEGLNDRPVNAYYIPEDNGEIPSVWVYQDGDFVCEAKKAQRFQEAKIEQTEDDHKLMGKQKRYIEQFDTVIEQKRSTLIPVGMVSLKPERVMPKVVPEVIHIPAPYVDDTPPDVYREDARRRARALM